jgi:hypothetical protein
MSRAPTPFFIAAVRRAHLTNPVGHRLRSSLRICWRTKHLRTWKKPQSEAKVRAGLQKSGPGVDKTEVARESVLKKQPISHDCRYRDNRGQALKSPKFDHIRHSQRTCEHHATNRHCALQRVSIRDCLLIIQGMPKAYPVRSPTHPNHLSAVLEGAAPSSILVFEVTKLLCDSWNSEKNAIR